MSVRLFPRRHSVVQTQRALHCVSRFFFRLTLSSETARHSRALQSWVPFTFRIGRLPRTHLAKVAFPDIDVDQILARPWVSDLEANAIIQLIPPIMFIMSCIILRHVCWNVGATRGDRISMPLTTE